MAYLENTECLERVMYVRGEMADRVIKTRARDWIHLETLDDVQQMPDFRNSRSQDNPNVPELFEH
jgi:hypothetical protein